MPSGESPFEHPAFQWYCVAMGLLIAFCIAMGVGAWVR